MNGLKDVTYVSRDILCGWRIETGIKITAYNGAAESFRFIRLSIVISYILGRYGMLYEDIAQLHDHKGCLNVFWKTTPSSEKLAALADAWDFVNEPCLKHFMEGEDCYFVEPFKNVVR